MATDSTEGHIHATADILRLIEGRLAGTIPPLLEAQADGSVGEVSVAEMSCEAKRRMAEIRAAAEPPYD